MEDSFVLTNDDLKIIHAYSGYRLDRPANIWWYAQQYSNISYNIALKAIQKAQKDSVGGR